MKPGKMSSLEAEEDNNRARDSQNKTVTEGDITSGSIRYQAVATGDHIACSLPTPLTACASRSISWSNKIPFNGMMYNRKA